MLKLTTKFGLQLMDKNPNYFSPSADLFSLVAGEKQKRWWRIAVEWHHG